MVNALQKEFMTIMGSASGGVASYELPGIQSRLEKLSKDINAALPAVKSPAGRAPSSTWPRPCRGTSTRSGR